ncbi:bactofilin family protein [Roseospirillum parvum]|uniref:Protein CcmA, bactofilin family n=1 Tax=Roseospirillum parvum TaxID=83401 RepID=A0A1G7WS32_9PROT|nr:polymer-forming cytoskeletal protein [Roseospirillum parvum]SDG74698.1 protein CcmA, bactofilin family [Roseospirillum parvum]
MFRRKDGSPEDPEDQTPPAPGAQKPAEGEAKGDTPPLKPFAKRGAHGSRAAASAASYNPEIPRRAPEIPAPATSRPGLAMPRAPGTLGTPGSRPGGESGDGKRLVVGRDIQLSGEISACDKLIVEGRVDANLTDATDIEVGGGGLFKGSAEVENADIAGRFEGELTARQGLIVRSTGQIVGTVRYSSIVIEAGGEISGTVTKLDGPSRSGGQ